MLVLDPLVRYMTLVSMSQHESADPWERAHRAARVIDDARERAIPRLSRRAAAQRAGITGEWWAHSVRGRRVVGGHEILVTPPDETLVRMARAVGVEAQVRNMLGLPEPQEEQPRPAHHGPRSANEILADMEALFQEWREANRQQMQDGDDVDDDVDEGRWSAG